ncbi:MAG TPA: hypothetical protein PK006_08665 [Saprospiraceae bacterium]|nr:hypothetical protein [Saprospiraceae bacterium]
MTPTYRLVHKALYRLMFSSLCYLMSLQLVAAAEIPTEDSQDSSKLDLIGFYEMNSHQKDSTLTSMLLKARLNLPLQEYCKMVAELEKKSWLHYLNEKHQPMFEELSMIITLLENEPTILIPYILAISSLYLTWGNVQQSFTIAQFAITKSLEHKEYLLLAKSYVSAGRSFGVKGDKLEAFRFLLKAKEVCDRYKFHSCESELWFEIGEYYKVINLNHKSYDAFSNAEKCIQKNEKVDTSLLCKYKVAKMEVLHQIDNSQFDEQSILNVLFWARAKGNVELEEKTSAIIRQTYIEDSNLDKIKMYYEVYSPHELKNLQKTDAYMYNKVRAYIFEANHQMDSAELYNLQAEKCLIEKSQDYYTFNFYLRLGQFYKRIQKIDKSILAFEKAQQKSKGLDVLPKAINVTSELYSLYEKIGDYKNAMKYMRLNMNYKDSLQGIANSEQMFVLKLSNEEQIRQIETESLNRAMERRFNLQYIGIILVLSFVFLAIILMGTYRWPEWSIRLSGFVAFIMLFEFIILILDQKIHHLTHGEPWKILVIKIAIISFLLPFHHWVEYKVMNYLITHKLMRFTRPSFYKIADTFKKWFTHDDHNIQPSATDSSEEINSTPT